MTSIMNAHEKEEYRCKVGFTLVSSSGAKINVSSATLVLTNQAIRLAGSTTYTVPQRGDRSFTGISVPLLFAYPHEFIQPWFGPYKWRTRITSANLLHLEPAQDEWTLTLIFNEGGAIEYRQHFLQQFARAKLASAEQIPEPLPAYTE